jgi:hypothetical protein
MTLEYVPTNAAQAGVKAAFSNKAYRGICEHVRFDHVSKDQTNLVDTVRSPRLNTAPRDGHH